MVLSAAPVVISKGSLRVNADDGLRSDSDDEPIVRPSTAAPGARATVVTTSTTENDNAEKPSSAPSSSRRRARQQTQAGPAVLRPVPSRRASAFQVQDMRRVPPRPAPAAV